MVGSVVILAPQERVASDMAPIDAIFDRLGPEPGAELISRAVTEMAGSLNALAGLVEAGDFASLPREARRLQRMAEGLGRASLARVAGDLGHCAACGDGTAFAAVWARLVRVAEQSLGPEWGFG
jgi:hypothetical protein